MFSAVKILRTSRMLQVKVAFLDGNPELLTFLPSSTVQDVRAKAQAVFGQKSLRLITYNCQQLGPRWFWANFRRSRDRGRRVPCSSCTSTTAGSNKEALPGVMHAIAVVFAAILADGSVVSWGDHPRSRQIDLPERHVWGFCCDSGRWIRRYLGFPGDSSAVRDELRFV